MRKIKYYTTIIFLLLFVMFFSACGEQDLLVSAQWVADHLNDEDIVLIETGRSREEYLAQHIPGASYLHHSDYYGAVDELPGMLTDFEVIAEKLGDIGVDNKKRIIIYDTGNALWSSRLFWTIEILGHNKVSLLDGGLDGWIASELPIAKGEENNSAGNFTPDFKSELLVEGDWLAANFSSNNVAVVDTRSVGEYLGEDQRASRGGHIPAAHNIEWSLALTDDRPYKFLPIEELAELYSSYDISKDNRVVTHCQTGVRGAHTYFVLRLLGYKDVALYDGSWAEWGNQSDYPIIAGFEG